LLNPDKFKLMYTVFCTVL